MFLPCQTSPARRRKASEKRESSGVNKTLVVLAAGMGSRYGGLKQVDPVGPSGEILLEYSVYDALRAGFDRLVCVIRRDLEEAFEASIGSRLRQHVAVEYAYQQLDDLPPGFTVPAGRSKPWGTGHAIWACRQLVQQPFLAINADDYYGPDSFRMLSEFLSQPGEDYAMVGFRLSNTLSEHGSVSRGLCRCDAQFWLEGVEEHTQIVVGGNQIKSLGAGQLLKGDEVVSMNFWGLRPSIFAELGQQFQEFLEAGTGEKSELYIPSVLDRIIREGRGRVKVLTSPESWFGVTYPEDKPRVIQAILHQVQAGRYPEQLWAR